MQHSISARGQEPIPFVVEVKRPFADRPGDSKPKRETNRFDVADPVARSEQGVVRFRSRLSLREHIRQINPEFVTGNGLPVFYLAETSAASIIECDCEEPVLLPDAARDCS